MVWVAGVTGFLIGFVGGISILNRWLKGRTTEELLRDKNLHRTYGLFVWIVAAVTSATAVMLYKNYF